MIQEATQELRSLKIILEYFKQRKILYLCKSKEERENFTIANERKIESSKQGNKVTTTKHDLVLLYER